MNKNRQIIGKLQVYHIQLVRLIILFPFFSIKNAGRYANSGLGQLFGCKKDTFCRFMNNGRTLTARYN